MIESQLWEEEGVESDTVITFARQHLKRRVEREFSGINFVLSGRHCFVYPDTLEVSKKELGDLKALSDAKN